MFRGSAPAKIDDKGRIKMPTAFRRQLTDQFGQEIFLTSIVGESVLIYPLPVWQELEGRLYGLPSTDRVKQRFLERVSYYGQQSKLDGQGRVVVPPLLRESAEMAGEIVVSARLDYFEVWNKERLQKRFTERPFSDDEFDYLSERGI